MNAYCEAKVPVGHGLLLVCGVRATGVYDYGCEHEHVLLGKATCDEHKPVAGEVGCSQCLIAGHDCPMTFRPSA